MNPVIEHMRRLGWYESHLFGHYYIRGAWCVGVWPDAWSLARATPEPGIYKILTTHTLARGAALRDLRIALLNATQLFPEEF